MQTLLIYMNPVALRSKRKFLSKTKHHNDRNAAQNFRSSYTCN